MGRGEPGALGRRESTVEGGDMRTRGRNRRLWGGEGRARSGGIKGWDDDYRPESTNDVCACLGLTPGSVHCDKLQGRTRSTSDVGTKSRYRRNNRREGDSLEPMVKPNGPRPAGCLSPPQTTT